MSRRKAHGFTLIELVIAITLLGMILALAYGGLRIGARSWEAAGSVSADSAELRMAQGFLRRQLTQVRAVYRQEEEERRIVFSGDADKVQFVVPMPVYRQGMGGLYLFTAKFVEEAGEIRLELVYRLYSSETGAPAEDDTQETTVLAEGIRQGEIAYFGAQEADEEPDWHDNWDSPTSLPDLVRFRVTRVNRDEEWPDLVIPVKSESG